MSDDSTEGPNGPALEAEGASTYTPPSYDIAPDDMATAEEIKNFDPIRDTAGPATTVGAVKLPTKLTRDMLPTDVKAQVDLRLESLPPAARAQAEESIIHEEATNYAYAVRVWGGPGENANAYQLEHFILENEIFDAKSKLSERLMALADIVRHDRKTDEQTGEVYDEPVYRMQGDARSASEHEVSDLRQRLALLEGSEGDARLRKALWQAVEDRKKVREELAIDREAQAQAKNDVRAARVNARAAGYRKFEETER